MDINSKEKGSVYATNPPSNSTWSFKGGYPIASFEIAAQNKWLDPRSLRLNGEFRIKSPLDTKPTNTASNGGPTTGMTVSGRVGVASVINQVTLSNSTNQTLETIRNYNRMLSTLMPVTHSQSDFDSCLQVADPGHASRSWNAARACNETTSFSIPLRTGLLSGGELLPLGQNGLRGLNISLELAPDSQVISGYRVYAPDNTETPVLFTPINTGAYYELENLQLTYDLLVPSDEAQAIMAAPATGSLSYNSFSQLYSVINASEQTQNFNFGVSNCLAVTHNFIPTNQINNYNFDGFSTGGLQQSNLDKANIKRVTYLRGSTRFPLDYEIETGGRADLPADQDRPQTELVTQFINSVKPYESMDHSLMSTQTQNGLADSITFDNTKTPRFRNTLPEPNQEVFGAGVLMDGFSKVGVDFRQTNYGIRLVSELDGASPNSIYTFVRARNNLTWSPNGIMVQS
tara:strand:+ start:4598 stop:5974 length:1377 start_codon:yes stop_codon:yes gene_type:complete